MQIVYNLHEVSDPIFLEKYEKIINLSSVEFTHSTVSVNEMYFSHMINVVSLILTDYHIYP